MKSDLVKLIKKLYHEDSSYRGTPPWQLLQGLEKKRLILSDMEIADEDITVLVKFFQTKQACKEIRTIEINRTCGASVYRRRTNSALHAHDHLLTKELLQFIAKCHHLQMLTFHLVKLSVAFMAALGRALTATTAPELRWLVFRSCHVGGDNGLREITPFLCQLPLQVLAFEVCKLTDASWRYIASIVKARENNLDDLYWNSTLRHNDINADKLSDEDREVLGDGLVALSLCGNKFTGAQLDEFVYVLKKAFWLLGLNLADNKLLDGRLESLLSVLKGNETMQACLLRGNPACSTPLLRNLYHSMASKAAQPYGEEKSAALSSGYARLDLLPKRVSWLLRSWMHLQSLESAAADPLSLEQLRSYSCLSYCLEPAIQGEVKAADQQPVLYDHLQHGQTKRRVGSAFHDLLFAPSDMHLDVSDQEYGLGDELDHGLPSADKPGKEDAWNYEWPDSRPQGQGQQGHAGRPPSRVSMRPKHSPSPPPRPQSAPTRSRSLTMSQSLSASGMPQPRYMQSRETPWRHAREAPQKRQHTERRSSPVRVRASTAVISPTKQRPWVPSSGLYSPPRARPANDKEVKESKEEPRRFTKSIAVSSRQGTPARRHSAPDLPKTKDKGKKKVRSDSMRTEMQALTALSTSVLVATKNLEHVSKRLRSVAQSLSESALVNISATAPMTPSVLAATPSGQRKSTAASRYEEQDETTYRTGSARVTAADLGMDMSFASKASDKEAHQQLAELVKQRMHSKLHSILSQELSMA